MAGSATDFLEDKILRHILNDTAYVAPATRYIGLFTTLPGDDGTGGVEVTGGSYARVAENGWSFPALGESENAGAITFPQATALWGTIVGFGVFDAAAGGNLLVYADLTTTKVVDNGDQPSFAVGALRILHD